MWDNSTGSLCGEILLDHYARHMYPGNFNGISDVFKKKGDLYENINGALGRKLTDGMAANIKAGRIFAPDAAGWDISLLWLVISQFWCDREVKCTRHNSPMTFRAIQAIYDFKCFRDIEWGHAGIFLEMSDDEYHYLCCTDNDPPFAYGQAILLIKALVSMVVIQSVRLGRPHGMGSAVLQMALPFPGARRDAAMHTWHDPEKTHVDDKTAFLWTHVLDIISAAQDLDPSMF